MNIKHVLFFILNVCIGLTSCSSATEELLKNELLGTWKEYDSYRLSEGDTVRFKVNPELFGKFQKYLNDPSEQWKFIKFQSRDTVEYISFPSSGIDGKYPYKLSNNKYHINGGYYSVKINDDILSLTFKESQGWTNVTAYKRVSHKVATQEYYDSLTAIAAPKKTVVNQKVQWLTRDSVYALNGYFPPKDKSAKFPGGNQNLFKLVSKNLVYPASERRAEVEGRVVVGFVVKKNGSASDFFIEESLSETCDTAAIKAVIKSMESIEWEPAQSKGKPVKELFLLPITFSLQ